MEAEPIIDQVNRIRRHAADSFAAVKDLGGSIPARQGLAQLPGAIRSLTASAIGKVQGAGVISLKLNSGADAYIPDAELEEKLLDGAKIYVFTPQAVYVTPVPSLAKDTTLAINVIPSPMIPTARIRIVLGQQQEEIVGFRDTNVQLAAGQVTEVTMDLDRYRGDGGTFLEIGRVQRLDQSTSGSYLIVRKYIDGAFSEERFGWYRNTDVNEATFPTNWVNDTGIHTFIPEMDATTGEQTNIDPAVTDALWERDIWPWNAARKVKVQFAETIFPTTKNAKRDFYFTEVPIYYVKNEVRTLTFDTKDSEGNVLSTADAECRIWWLSKVNLPGYELPAWEKKWVYEDQEDAFGQHNYVKTSVPKAANYYACYKSVTKSNVDGNVIQSYPWGEMVAGLSRGSMCDYSKTLNGHVMRIYNSDVFPDGTELAADTTNRRFTGNTWLEFQAFRYLMYIQFGTDIQETLLGLTVNNSSSNPRCWQNSCEQVFEASPNTPTFSVGLAKQSNPICWLWIVNPHGSEGDQMADATTFAERIAAGTQTTMLVMLDRALMQPHATDKQLMLDGGYDQLDYMWTAVGKTGTHKRGLDSRPEFWAYQFPAHNDATAAVELGSSDQVDSQWLSGHPAEGTLGAVARMCSLSISGGFARALGPWCAYSNYEPSLSDATKWGARVSMVLSAAEAEGVGG